MKEKGKKSPQKTGRTRTNPAKNSTSSSKTRASKPQATENAEASEQFVKGVLVRGEAAKPDAEGKLQQDATHAITKENEDGTVEVKRARFKYY